MRKISCDQKLQTMAVKKWCSWVSWQVEANVEESVPLLQCSQGVVWQT